jgi:diacyltrehalose acyltransferase
MYENPLPKKRSAHKILVAVATAAAMFGTLVLGHAANTTAENLVVRLANTVIGAGGMGDPTSVRVPNKLASTVVPATYGYSPIDYPADINLAASRDVGVPLVRTALMTHSGEPLLIVAGYSEGALVAEQVRRDLQAQPADSAPSDMQLTFVMVASPFAGDGGILARFPWLYIPWVIDPMGAGQPTRYDTTYHAIEYDIYADFPAYFNPLALLNSVFAIRYAHPDPYYDPIDPAAAPKVQKVVPNSAGGTDTYVLYLNSQLPLFGPVREAAAALSLTRFTEPVLTAIEPLVRLFVDMAYTDRTYANPETPKPFSLITPPAKVVDAVLGIPGALAQGAANLLSGGQPSMTPKAKSVDAVVAPEQQAPDAGDQRLALAPVAEPEAKSTISDLKADAGPKPAAESRRNRSADHADQKATDKRDPQRITHPKVTSDGNKVTPTTTVGGTTPGGNKRVVELVSTADTNSADDKGDSTTATPTADTADAASTTVDANDDTSNQATDDAAA